MTKPMEWRVASIFMQRAQRAKTQSIFIPLSGFNEAVESEPDASISH